MLFYNFNNSSRANTASGGKRGISLGQGDGSDGQVKGVSEAIDSYKTNQIPLDKLMYSTDAFQHQYNGNSGISSCNYAQLYQQQKLIKVTAQARADQAMSRDRVPTRNGKSRRRRKRMIFKDNIKESKKQQKRLATVGYCNIVEDLGPTQPEGPLDDSPRQIFKGKKKKSIPIQTIRNEVFKKMNTK